MRPDAPKDMPTLEALALEAVHGDAHALSALCRALESPIYRLCVRILGDPRDAEDAAQDVLIKVVTNLALFEGRGALLTWVHTITVRHVLALKKSRAEERALDEEAFSAMLEQGLALSATLPAPTAEDHAFLDEVRLSCTQGMLLMLSRQERLALVLVELLGFEGAEAAEIAEVSHDALRQQLTRGRKKLGEFLRARCGLANDEATCRCEAQLPAKRALSKTLRFLPIAGGDLPMRSASEGRAELSELRALAAAFRSDGLFQAPASLRRRMQEALPHLLGAP
jgi:RNA polymerase sigma factor (sigma-70 family)